MSGHLISSELGCQAGTGASGRGGKGSLWTMFGHFLREVAAFEAAGHVAAGFEAAPVVPSCPGWVATDLVLHLGVVHRAVSRVIGERMQQPPERGDMPWLGLAEEWRGWLPPARAPQRSPVPAGLLGWFHDGSADLYARFRATAPEEQVWTWSADHSVGFWQRMQAIEAAVHRWDAENAVGAFGPSMRSLPPMPSGRPSRSWLPCAGAWGRRRQGTASGSCSSALTGQGGGQCGSMATLSCLVRLTAITTFKSQAPRLTWRFSFGSVP